MSTVSAAEHLFRSTQWAHAWHDGFHWAQITHIWVHSSLVCSSKKQCKTARKNKSQGCEMANCCCCSLFNEASQHSRWFSRCYLPILQMHTLGLCKTLSRMEKLKELSWDIEVFLLLPASWLQNKRLGFFLIKTPPKEKQPQNMHIEEKDLLAGVPWVKASSREKEHLCLVHFLHWTEWFYVERLTAKSIPLSTLQS